MNCKRESTPYGEQLGYEIAEMKAANERLRTEINELLEMKEYFKQLNELLKKELKGFVEDLPF